MTKTIVRQLKGKPTLPVTYETASREYGRQVGALMDRMALSKSATIQAALSYPQKFRWELVYDRGDDSDLENLDDYEIVLARIKERCRVYLKVVAGSAPGVGGGAFISAEEITGQIPERVLAMIEQRARLLSSRAQAAEPAALVATVTESAPPTNGQSLVTVLDNWYERHSSANRRLYYVARDLLKNLMESEHDKR